MAVTVTVTVAIDLIRRCCVLGMGWWGVLDTGGDGYKVCACTERERERERGT